MRLPRRVRKCELALKILALFLLIVNLMVILTSSFMSSTLFAWMMTPSLPKDDQPPVILLKGPDTVRIATGTKFEDPGVEAYDLRSESFITSEGEVNNNIEGDYTIRYTACDTQNNCAIAERHVQVLTPTGIIYLTFDDGPSEFTEKLLDILKQYHIFATFFVTGRGADETLKREFDEGHAIGLHSFSHDYAFIYQNTVNFWEDMDRVQNRVKSITGQETKLMRFPGGSSNTISMRYDGRSHIMSKLVHEVEERGFSYFDWNVLSGDAGETTETDKVVENVTTTLKQGGISVVLQHDSKGFSVDAVERIIQFGLEHGYIFDKLSADSFKAHHGVNN